MADVNQIAFNLWDKDHTGSISTEAFTAMLQNLNEDISDVDKVIAAVDDTKSGSVSFHDFVRVCGKTQKNDSDPVKDVFDYMDQDKDDMISYNELYDLLEALGLTPNGDEVSLLFEELDQDKDGKISRQDWQKAVALTT